MSQLPPDGPSGGSPNSPYPQQPYLQQQETPREGKPVSFYIAIFLGLLLFVSGGLNLLLLVVSAFGSATAGLGVGEEDSALYDVVAVGGDQEAEARLLRIPVYGAIAESSSPVIGASGGTVSLVERGLRVAARSSEIRGVLLDINSPGGGVTDSDLIYRAIQDFRAETEKPVVALFGDMAASGGYYIAAACDRILARETSITGSIGVIMSNLNFAEAAAQFGISQDVITSDRTPYKDMMSQFRPMKPDEQAILESIVNEMYDRFVDVVYEGRKIGSGRTRGIPTRDDVVSLADGRIYSARQALDANLIDAIGTEDDAIDVLETLCEVDSAGLVEHRRRPTFVDLLMGARAERPSMDTAVAQLLTASSGPRFLYWWPGAR